MGFVDKFLDVMKLNDDGDFVDDEFYQDYEEDNYYNDKPSSRRDNYMKRDNNYNDLDDFGDFDDYGYDKRDRNQSKRRDGSSRSVMRSDRPERNDRMDRSERNDRMDRSERNDRMDRGDRFDRNDRSSRMDREDRMDRAIRNDSMDRNERNDRYEREDRSLRAEESDRFESRQERNIRESRNTNDKPQVSVRPSVEKKNPLEGMGVCVLRPTSVEDSRDIVDTLIGNRTVVLNLEGLDIDVAQRIIDFSSGACFAINGNLQKVSQYIFLLTPSNVNISGDLNNLLGQKIPGINNAEDNY